MKIITIRNEIKFPFEKYCNIILSIVPKSDLVGISEIRFVEKFSHPKSNQEALAHYLQGANGKNAIIEIHMPNLLKQKISQYYYEIHPEIAALYLSGIIFHEIGHHVHQFKRHGVKKNRVEKFAESYSNAGYFNYLRYRKQRILSSYTWGSRGFVHWNKEERNQFKESRQELIELLKENKDGIPFP